MLLYINYKILKTLTIAIPTYNGAPTIKRLLDSIFIQNFSKDDVDVIVCDNCSTDNTLEILKPFHNKIKIFKNETNLGGDRNFRLCVEHSESEYVWIIGDDDFLRSDAISEALEKITKEKYACIFVNFSLYDIKLQRESLQRYLPIKYDIETNGISNFLQHTTIAANFLSAMIHRRDLFLSVDVKEYLGSCWLQFAVILDYVNNDKVLIIAEPLVVNMGDSSDREFNVGGVAVKIMSNLYTIVKNAKSIFIEPKIRQQNLDIIHERLKYRILAAKRLGLKVDNTLFLELKNNFGSYPSFWFIDVVLLYLPNFIIRIIYGIYRNKYVNKLMSKIMAKR